MLGRRALQDEAPVAVTAIDVTFLVDLHVDARMTERSRAVVLAAADVAGAVAPDVTGFDGGDFGGVAHEPALTRRPARGKIAALSSAESGR
jgi:hypothetical protein